MRKNWVIGGIIGAVLVGALVVFNYQGGKDAVPLSEIFPHEDAFPVDAEYEFASENTPVTASAKTATGPMVASVAAVPSPSQAPAELIAANSAAVEKISGVKTAAFTIQIASFNDQKKAQDALSVIRAKVPSAYIGSRDLGEKGVWYRVYAGKYERRSEAEVALNDIKQSYNSSFIISPK